MKAVILTAVATFFLLAQGVAQAQQQDFSKLEIQTKRLPNGTSSMTRGSNIAANGLLPGLPAI